MTSLNFIRNSFCPRPGLVCVLLAFVVATVVTGRHVRQEPELGQGCLNGALGGGGLCCQGQNATCMAAGARQNDKNSATCFCDEICPVLGDCCLDYRLQCPVVDCVLSERWSDWSECDARCGFGIQTRTKSVLSRPRNGGSRCPDMIERRKCEGTNCKVARASEAIEELKETGEIIPASYASWRTNSLYSPFEDIRSNLFREQSKYAEMRRDNEKPSYCAKYKITEARQSCQRATRDPRTGEMTDPEPWVRKLVRGTTICVECQPFAMDKTLGSRCTGHGVNQRHTHWKAVTMSRCHGSWVMTSSHVEQCKCDKNSDASFVFV